MLGHVDVEGSETANALAMEGMCTSPLWARREKRGWGVLSTSPEDYHMWHAPSGRVLALAQFRDNVIVAAAEPGSVDAMYDVCETLSSPPLQCYWVVQDVALANLYTSVLVNILPFIRSWGGASGCLGLRGLVPCM